MKKLLGFLILPLIMLSCLFSGCGEDKTINDVKEYYQSMVNSYKVEETNKIFSNSEKSNTICIKYSDNLQAAINNTSDSNDILKRYRALYYQQLILNNIFNFYEKHQESFYRIASGEEVEQDDVNNLYNKLVNLNEMLGGFSEQLSLLEDSITNGGMVYIVTNYTYQLNKVIDCSFDFMYSFMSMYETYCIDNNNKISADLVEIMVDMSYVDIVKVIYLENFKAFDYSVGEKGVCDLAPIVYSENKLNLTKYLSDIKPLSDTIKGGLQSEALNYESTLKLVKDFLYVRDVFHQRFDNYKTIYNEQDMFMLNKYRYGVVGGVDYDTYLNTLSVSEKSCVDVMEDFVLATLTQFIEKLNLLV